MTVFKSIARVTVLLLISCCSFAQNYLEFIENKGQWDSHIRYKGDMTNGAFALQSTGYRVILHNKEDLAKLGDAAHNPHIVSAALSGTQEKRSTDAYGDKAPIPPPGGGGGGGTKPAQEVIVRSHAYEMRFLNANPNPQIIADKPMPGISNYILGNDPSKWVNGCVTYQALTYKNVYPNIDVRYYTSDGVLKYDIIVNPGGDISNVAMYYEGVDGIKVKDGGLIIKTSVEDVKEMPPYTYQLIHGTRQEVPCSYDVKGNIVRFKIQGAYVKTSTLVVDPALVFSTFTGSTADNWGYTATYDGQGNFYAGGIVFGDGGAFPVSNGAFQQKFGGGGDTGEKQAFDIGIMKFDASGANRIYATYIGGGSGNEQPHSMVVDAAGNLIVAGRTTSSDYPLAGALQQYKKAGSPGGGWDIVITKLNATGTGLISSVKVIGAGQDGVNIKHKYPVAGAQSINRNYGDDARSEVLLDGAGNIYLASCTQSADFPTTPGAFQAVSGGSDGVSQDAVLMKFTPDLSSVIFSTRLGGKNDDAAFVLAVNPITGNVLVAGATASADFPGDKTGALYSTFQGGLSDGFVAEFTATGTYVRGTYVGTGAIDLIYGIQFDKFGFPYIMGTTTGSWPVLNATYSQTNGKQFIAKLQQNLSGYVYSTVFGTNNAAPNISPIAFLVDRCENVYVSGWGGQLNIQEGFPNAGTRGLPVTPDAYLSQSDGSDFYFFVMEKNATSQLYGTFFGQQGGLGEHVDGGTSRFDRNGVIYQAMCANCGRPQGVRFPTSPAVWSPTNGSTSGCNLAAVKIAFNLAGIAAGIQASINGVIRDTTGCVPLTADFRDTLAMAQQYIWDFGDGTTPETTTSPVNSHTFNNVGNYRVKLTAVDSSSCNISDSTFVTMRVRNDEAVMSFNSNKLPPCSALDYLFTNTSVAPPGKPFTDTSFLWMFGDNTTLKGGAGSVTHTYAAPGTYDIRLVLIDTSYCNYDDTIRAQIRIASNLTAQFETPALGCMPYTAVFNNTSIGGQQFRWDFGDGTTSTQTSPNHLYTGTGTYTVTLVAIDSSTCNIADTTSFTITVNPNPTSVWTYTPQPTEPNTPITFLNSSVGATRYKWIFGDGDTLVTIQRDTLVRHMYNATGKYNACLVAYNNSGCSDTSCQTLEITIVPAMDVPNAFSPNGDGRNDRIYVRGYGIAKMTWRIYNRWGVTVYVGTEPSEGWDGFYRGVLQPQDVYHYTVQVEFSDGEKALKKGDITLLR